MSSSEPSLGAQCGPGTNRIGLVDGMEFDKVQTFGWR